MAVDLEVVFVVLEEFLEAGLGHIHQLDFGLGGRRGGRAPLDDILLAATGGLHHLVNSTVAARQKVRTEVARHLIDYICLPVAQQLLVVARIGHKFVHAVFSLKVSNRLR